MDTLLISKITARRFVLGRQGLWPGRRWAGISGTADALRAIEAVQMDPLTVVARSHDIVLWSRVHGYQPADLDQLLYHDRQFFDYGGGLFILRERVAPPEVDYAAPEEQAERFFARKSVAFMGLLSERSWASGFGWFVERRIGRDEARHWLDMLIERGEFVPVRVEESKERRLVLAFVNNSNKNPPAFQLTGISQHIAAGI